MTRDFLLNQAISEFKDKETRVLKVPFKRVLNAQGFTFLEIDYTKQKEISSAIHIARDYALQEGGGRLHSTKIDLSTREPLDINNDLIIYKGKDFKASEPYDLFIFAKSFSGYNETMRNYMYLGEALLLDRVSALSEISDTWGFSSFDIFAQMPKHTILPHYENVEPYLDIKFILLKINTQEAQTLAKGERDMQGAIMQDNITFTLNNYTRKDTLDFLQDLENFSLDSGLFGYISLPQVSELENLQSAPNLRAFGNKITMDIQYFINSERDYSADLYIKKALYKMQIMK